MQLHNDADTQLVKRFKRQKVCAIYCIYDIKFYMLQVRENEISLRKWSDSAAHLRTLEGTLPIMKKQYYVLTQRQQKLNLQIFIWCS